MSQIELALMLLVLLFALLAGGVQVAVTLMLVGVAAIVFVQPLVMVGPSIVTSLWGAVSGWELVALPMFVWMGEILYRSRLSEDLFNGLAPWLSRLPGGLFHVNVVGSTIFAAVSGSSAATAVTIGKISLPQLSARGYDERMAIGSLAGAATLGLLIPPSIIMIVYGAATEQSIARLFIAGVIPGLLLAAMFMSVVMVWAMLNSARMPPREHARSLPAKMRATLRLIPVILLFIGIIGSIYGGFASPTEAAAVGVAVSLILSWSTGTLSMVSFRDGLLGATRTSCMICFILAGAAVLTTAMGFTGIPRALAQSIAAMELSQAALIAALTVLFLVLGCFLDGISMVVLTTAVIIPLVQAAGIDLMWFGIFIVIVVEMAQITPPVGFNLFVLQGLTGRSIFTIAGATLPFFVIMVLMVVLLVLFPGLALWLPSAMLGG